MQKEGTVLQRDVCSSYVAIDLAMKEAKTDDIASNRIDGRQLLVHVDLHVGIPISMSQSQGARHRDAGLLATCSSTS